MAEDHQAVELSAHSLTLWRLTVVIASVSLGVFLFGLDINIIGTAIPRITTDFHSLGSVSWYGSAYLLTVTAFQPFFGNLYKNFSTKIVYLASLLIFEVGSIICALAPVSGVLIFGRAFLGFGAAGLMQGGLAVIGQVVRKDKVPLFQGLVLSSLFVSVGVGPIIGGALTQYASWRWCFWINVPIGACTMIAVLLFMPNNQASTDASKTIALRQKLRHLDAIGTFLFAATVCCFLLPLTWGGQTYPWNDPKVIALFVLSGILFICFCTWLWHQRDLAIIPLRVLKQRSICMGSLVLFTLGIASQVYAYYLPIFFQSAQGTSTIDSGIRYLALAVPVILSLLLMGGLVAKWGYYVPYMIAGSVITSVGSGLLTTIDPSTSTAIWATYMVIAGLGLGMAQQLPYTAVQVVLDQADIPIGNAIGVFCFQLGGALGLGMGQNLLLRELQRAVPRYTDAVTPAQVIGAGATGLVGLSTSPATLQALRQAYSDSVRSTLILALVASCLAFAPSCAMERLNLKHVASQSPSTTQSHTQSKMEIMTSGKDEMGAARAEDCEVNSGSLA